MSRAWWIGVTAATIAAAPGTAAADNGWEAQFLGKSSDLTLESGEIGVSWLLAKNIGTNVWQTDPAVAPPVRLGASNPRDRSSVFASDVWLSPARVTLLDRSPVRPGENGGFTFRVRAPAVDAERGFLEHFEPLAERTAPGNGGWMGSAEGPPKWPLGGVPIAYRVLPGQPPAVQIDAAPATAQGGATIDVAATATDNVRVNRLEFRLDDRPPAVVPAPGDQGRLTVTGRLDTSGLPVGNHGLHVTALDGSNRIAIASRQIAITPPPPPANGANATRNATLVAGFGRKRSRSRTTVSYGRGTTLRGRLTGERGVPITGATVRIATRVLSGRRDFRELSVPLPTGPRGEFSYNVPPGASRQIRLSYTAFSADAAPAATRVVRFSTRAGVRLSVRPRRVRNGRRVRLTGSLRGGRVPSDGVLVALQGRQPGFGWRTFTTARTSRRGRFATRYRFRTIRNATSVRFRAVVRRQTGYPYTTGRSPVRRVRVRP